jgi:uncharacterized protein (UPF0264 family)
LEAVGVPGLLVSVRSAEEARAALLGGVNLIDIKEPSNGPLGRADPHVWHAISREVAGARPLSVALGELSEVRPGDLEALPAEVAYRKVGFANAGRDWVERWAELRASVSGPAWVAVIYADWQLAHAPRPDEIVSVALDLPECRAVLVDTYEKGQPSPLDLTWRPLVESVRNAGRLVLLAGGLDLARIHQLKSLDPDYFAVRGAACRGRDRVGQVDSQLVADLVRAAGPMPDLG